MHCRISFGIRIYRGGLVMLFVNLITCHHLNSFIYHINLVEGGVPDVVVHVYRIGIAAHLRLGLIYGCLYLQLGCAALQILQLYDIGMFHILEYLATRTEEDIGIAVLVVKLGDRTIKAALAGEGKGLAMHESLSLLPIPLRGKDLQTLCYVSKEGLEVTIISHRLCFLIQLIYVK